MEPYVVCYLSLYFLVLGILCVYGMHRTLMTWLYRHHEGDSPPVPRRFEELPFVTIQLPLYNEPRVVERLLRATCAIDYPRERFEVQVLDDSTDETSRIVARLLPEFEAKGITLRHIRRKTRTGFKAGALARGLEMARGEFLLVFDADFVPPSDILHRMIHHFT
ncbi:MAG: glycosyltransferase, partial [Deltaproteobacteria bacterium]